MKNQAISRLHPHQKRLERASEHGGALFLILIAIALFAALSYALTLSSRSGQSNISTERAKLAAGEMIQHSNAVHQALKTLLVKGCTDETISFESPETGVTYRNNSSPTDRRCDVFHFYGGSTKYVGLPQGAQTLDTTADDWYFTGSISYEGIGTGAPELSMYAEGLQKDVCMQINNLLGIPNDGSDAPDDETDADVFTGSYPAATPQNTLGEEAAALKGQQSFCRKDGTNYFFHKVLITR